MCHVRACHLDGDVCGLEQQSNQCFNFHIFFKNCMYNILIFLIFLMDNDFYKQLGYKILIST